MKRIYFDHAATTPLHPFVVEEMNRAMIDGWGNPSSLHTEGRLARKIREEARNRVADLLCVHPENIYFTASGSESDQWALVGLSTITTCTRNGHFITSTVEHSAIRNISKKMSLDGSECRWLKPDSEGRIPPALLEDMINTDTKFVSLMYCNNELGTINDICKLSEKCHAAGALFHTDAVQGLGKLPSPAVLGPDVVSVASHKINGPKGIGALWVSPNLPDFPPWVSAASQERGKHAGTEAIPAIAGFGAACKVWKDHELDFKRSLTKNKVEFLNTLKNSGVKYSIISPQSNVSDSIVNIRFHSTESEALLLGFDLVGIAASAGSACASGALKPSGVLLEIGLTEQEASECVRFSFGAMQPVEEVIEGATRVVEVMKKYQSIGIE